jgi:hypothetical protein
MEETKKSYQKQIQKYFNLIYPQFEEAVSKVIKHDYPEDIEYVEFIIYQGAFYADGVGAMMIFNDGGGDEVKSNFSTIRPLIDENLDFYNIDFEYRGSVFMNEIFLFFSRAWDAIIGKDNKSSLMQFYVQEDNGRIRFSMNSKKISQTPIL